VLDVCEFSLKERKRNAELRELLGLETIRLVTRKSEIVWTTPMNQTLYSGGQRGHARKTQCDGVSVWSVQR